MTDHELVEPLTEKRVREIVREELATLQIVRVTRRKAEFATGLLEDPAPLTDARISNREIKAE